MSRLIKVKGNPEVRRVLNVVEGMKNSHTFIYKLLKNITDKREQN